MRAEVLQNVCGGRGGRGVGVKSTAYFAEAATSATGHVAWHGSP